MRWMRDPVAHYGPGSQQPQPQPQPRPQGVPRYNLPSIVAINQRRWKEVLNDREEPRRREARRRREVSAARARQEAAKRVGAALKDQRQHSARRNNVLAVQRLPAGNVLTVQRRRRVTPPLEFTRLIVEERASERSGEPSEGLAKQTRMGASSQATSAARRGHLGAGGAPGVAKPTPVGLLARDFQHFMKMSRQQTHTEQHRRYVEEQQRREELAYMIEQHMNAHGRS